MLEHEDIRRMPLIKLDSLTQTFVSVRNIGS